MTGSKDPVLGNKTQLDDNKPGGGGGEFLTYAGEVGGEEGKPIYLLLKPAAKPVASDKSIHEAPPQKGTLISVFAFHNTQFIKDTLRAQVRALKNIKTNKIKLLYKGIEIKQGKLINDYNLDGSKDKPTVMEYSVSSNQEYAGGEIELVVDKMVLCTKKMEARIQESLIALNAGRVPRLATDGTGGTYFMPHPNGRGYCPLACFKPKDEEPCAPNNPRGFPGKENSDGFRPGIYSAQGAFREVCAFLLDHSNFAGVPDTALVHARHTAYNNPNGKIMWKTGSFQEFMDAKETAGNYNAKEYDTEDIHKIGIFDLRVVNMDRNDGNVLVMPRKNKNSSSKYQLIPIDHGLILPDRLEIIEEDVVWMSWPQAKEPFSTTCIEYVRHLRYDKEARDAAKYLGINRDPLRLMKCAAILLQIGVSYGLTLYDIGTMMYRQDLDVPSVMQDIITQSQDTAVMYGGIKGARQQNKSYKNSSLSGLNLETSRMTRVKGMSKPLARHSVAHSTPAVGGGMVSDSSNTSSTTSMGKPPQINGKARVQSDFSDGWTSPAPSPQMSPSLTPAESMQKLALPNQVSPSNKSDSLEEDHDLLKDNDFNPVVRPGVGTAVRLSPSEASMSIFSRPDEKGKETVTWVDDLETVFLDYVKQEIESHINICKTRAIKNNSQPYYGKEIQY